MTSIREAEEFVKEDLSQYIALRPVASTNRAYVRDSMASIAPIEYEITNISTTMEISAELSSVDGITFSTPTVILAAGERKTVRAFVDAVKLNHLPEGVNTIQVFANLTARKMSPSVPELIPFPKPPIIVDEFPHWQNGITRETLRGFPPQDWVLGVDGFWYPPKPKRAVSVDFNYIEIGTTAGLSAAQFSPVVHGDDLSTFTYTWDFDVGRTGTYDVSGTSINPQVTWHSTGFDTSFAPRVRLVVHKNGEQYIAEKIVVLRREAPTVPGGRFGPTPGIERLTGDDRTLGGEVGGGLPGEPDLRRKVVPELQ